MTLEEIKGRLETHIPGCQVSIVINGSPSAQHSLLIDRQHAPEIARFLRQDSELQLDFCSNVTAVDWPDHEKTEKIKTKKIVDGVEKEVEETRKTITPGYLEAVYHLFSVCKKEGPLIVRIHTPNRAEDVTLPSLTPVWRSAEFQEREAFDLFGIVFEGHPDLRRILMWEGFTDHPMRKDYVPPPEDDLESLAVR
ncbi:MAG TPA: NADH-quinone oxidoreductase subunit C [Acidobacteriaceae bacterium]|jgi:NADH-quinone oxidoreductase subunit C